MAPDEDVIKEDSQISQLTTEFLMPEVEINELWSSSEEPSVQVEHLSRMFKVDRPTMAARLRNLGLIDLDPVELNEDSDTPSELEESNTKPPIPNYYRTYSSRISPAFKKAVIKSAEAGEIEYTYAFKLLGVKGKSYDKVKEDVLAND